MSDHYYRHSLLKWKTPLTGRNLGKRKRNEDQQDDIDSDSSADGAQVKPSHSSWAELTAKDIIQRRTAGLSQGEAVPDSPFPNRPTDYYIQAKRSAAPSEVQRELAKLREPLVDHIQRRIALQNSASSLKQQHITVLYTLLNRCLLDRDYIRAGRAFGLLLRTDSLGKMADLRENNLWGIGAEILLERKNQELASNNSTNEDIYPTGIQDAKEYYEKLIIQFPYRIRAPNLVSAVHFYPVLFGLWIISVERKHRNAMRTIRDLGDPGQENSIDQIEELEDSRRTILTEAQAIMHRLEETMRSIPYSDNPTLWRLKGHMYLWIHDLSVSHYDLHGHPSTFRADGMDRDSSIDQSATARTNAQTAFATAHAHEQRAKDEHVQHNEAEEE